MALNLDYYYGNEADQYSFYRIPKVLFTDARYRTVSVEAKVLYGLLLDRMALSIKNNWLDEDGRVFIIYTISEVMEILSCAEQKANKLLTELDSRKGVGLIERKRRGLGKPNVIYVKNFIDKATPKLQIQNCDNHNSRDANITTQELRISQTNNTDSNNTDYSDTDLSILSTDQPELETKMDTYRELIEENISYDSLVKDNPYDQDRLDGYVELMVEVCCSGRNSIRINQEDMPTKIVKSRFLKLNCEHIRYVMDSLGRNTTHVGNIKAYTLSALFNAPVTIDQYYTSRVSHDMANRKPDG